MSTPIPCNMISGVIFDLDNTLVSSALDFDWLRQQLSCAANIDLLQYIADIPDVTHRKQLEEKVIEHELADARQSTIMPECENLLSYLRQQKIPTAVVTRNCAQAAKLKIDHHQLQFDRIVSREEFPPKPAPDALLDIAKQWQLVPQNILYVGDYIYDLQAAFRANMPSCLVTNGDDVRFTNQASIVVQQLDGLTDILREQTCMLQREHDSVEV
ncbi:HAD family hydrolase [Photobacterium iliopiscarium]|uniref:HAD family hydrolase n=1 Tax=Photobacterium iliopiscarium TaxID=56192 RepID=UPI000D15547A|nr:HAD family hydrolase [Photobacterium iliopiscarium]PST99974.1 phosphatase [Photobacterium iliopiscarium]PSV85206.1 phosphatase [Photobacterium iliopiscarium]